MQDNPIIEEVKSEADLVASEQAEAEDIVPEADGSATPSDAVDEINIDQSNVQESAIPGELDEQAQANDHAPYV